MTKALRNRRGDVPISSAIMVVVFAMVIAAALYIAYVYIQTTNVRNAMNKGLSNLAITISEDTYAALRESNFDEYANKLTSTSAYQHALETKYKQDVLGSVELDNERYKIENISLDFEVDGKKITYTCDEGTINKYKLKKTQIKETEDGTVITLTNELQTNRSINPPDYGAPLGFFVNINIGDCLE